MRLDKKTPSNVTLFYEPTGSFLKELPFNSYSSIDEIRQMILLTCAGTYISGKVSVHVSQDGGYFKRFVMIVKRTNKTI